MHLNSDRQNCSCENLRHPFGANRQLFDCGMLGEFLPKFSKESVAFAYLLVLRSSIYRWRYANR